MAITRASQKHKKFNDDEEFHTAEESVILSQSQPEDEEEEDSDEAPEEQGLGSTKQRIEDEERERHELLEIEQNKLKQKRKQQNKKFADQQKQKKKFQEEEPVEEEHYELEMAEELPEEFFDEVTEEAPKPKKIKFNDEDVMQSLKAEIQKEKKNTLKALRKKTLNKGPVTVSVLGSGSKTLAPKKEAKITKTKDQWLKRKSLGKR